MFKITKSRWLLCACLFVFSLYIPLALATDSKSVSLNIAIEKTLDNNPQLKQFEFKNQQLRNDKEFAQYRPGFELALEVENFAGSGELSGFDAAETTLALSSVIELGGKRQHRTSLANTRLSLLEVNQQAQTIDVLGNLTQVFINGISTQEKIRLSQESIHLHEDVPNTVRARVNKGIAHKAELMRADAALVKERIKLRALERKLATATRRLATFWQSRSPEFDSLSGDLYNFDSEVSFDALYEKVLQSPAIEIYASQSRLKQAELKLAQSSNKTNIEWQVGLRQFQETDDTALVAGFSVPLFTGKRNRTQYRNTQLDLDVIDNNKERVLVELHQNLFEAYSARQQAIEAEELISKEIIPSLEKSAKLVLKGYESGRFKYQDVVSAQEELIAAKWLRLENATVAQLNQSIIEQLIAEPLSE